MLQGLAPPPPCSDVLQSARMDLSAAIQQVLPPPECGGPANSFPRHGRPIPAVSSATPSRSCLANYNNNCIGVTFSSSDTTYSNVCGQAVGYATGSPDAFNRHGRNASGIDNAYLDGVSVTHGPRHAAYLEFHSWLATTWQDHLSSTVLVTTRIALKPPCLPSLETTIFVTATTAPHPAVPSTLLPCSMWLSPCTSTSDDIEVRLCADENVRNEGTHLRLLKLYVL